MLYRIHYHAKQTFACLDFLSSGQAGIAGLWNVAILSVNDKLMYFCDVISWIGHVMYENGTEIRADCLCRGK